MRTYNILKNTILNEENPQQLAQIALSNVLFVRGWNLQEDLKSIIKNGLGINQDIMLATLADYPVGVCVKCDNQLQIFVRRPYRNYGIGGKLVSTMKAKYADVNFWAYEGTKGTLEFWSKQEVKAIP